VNLSDSLKKDDKLRKALTNLTPFSEFEFLRLPLLWCNTRTARHVYD